MADKVQLIKREIQSYKESMKGLEPHSDFRRGQLTAYNQIMQFIDSLPEEPTSDDLEEEIKNYFSTWLIDLNNHKEFLLQFARHFAEWQKQRMMKNSVHAWVNTYESVENPYDNQVSFITNLSPSKFRNKETAQIIIVKTEQQ